MKLLQLFFVLSLWSIGQLQAQTVIWASSAHPDGLQVNGVGFSSDGNRILTGTNCHPAKIRLFDRQTGHLEWDYSVDILLECIMGVGFSANGKYLATAEETGNLLVFDYEQQPPVLKTVIGLNTDYAFALDFSPDSKTIAVGASGGKLKTYRVADSAPLVNITAHSPWVTAIHYEPAGTKIASGGSDNRVKIWDTTGVLLHNMAGHTGDVSAVRFTPDNQRLVSGALDGKIKVWNPNTGALITTILSTTTSVVSLDISPDGQYLVAACGDGLLRLWNLNDYQLIGSFGDLLEGDALTVDWSPTENVVAAGTASSRLVLYQLAINTPTSDPVLTNRCAITPNPVQGWVSIDWPSEKIETAALFDLQGKMLHQFDCDAQGSQVAFSWPLSIPIGVYILKVTSASGKTAPMKIMHH